MHPPRRLDRSRRPKAHAFPSIAHAFPSIAAAFSLIELLITVALIIIMSVMLYGFGSRSNQAKKKKACQKNLHTIYMGLEIYANEHEQQFPVIPGATTSEEPLSLLIPQYTVASEAFICPGSKDSPLPSAQKFGRGKISYAYQMGWRLSEENSSALLVIDELVDTKPAPIGTNLFSVTGKPPGNNHHKYGGNNLTVDGTVDMISPGEPYPLEWPSGVVMLNPRE